MDEDNFISTLDYFEEKDIRMLDWEKVEKLDHILNGKSMDTIVHKIAYYKWCGMEKDVEDLLKKYFDLYYDYILGDVYDDILLEFRHKNTLFLIDNSNRKILVSVLIGYIPANPSDILCESIETIFTQNNKHCYLRLPTTKIDCLFPKNKREGKIF